MNQPTGQSRRSFESALAELCAPTLARVKPASLFRYQPAPGVDLARRVAHWDAALSELGVTVRALKTCPRTGAVLVYVYRPGWLGQILADPAVGAFLEQEGYRPGDAEALLGQLSRRLCCREDFPHEIGVFLGYPLEDVVGFIRNRGRNYTYCGYWKAYGDPIRAQQCFARYKKCEEIYKRLFAGGTPLRRLTVAA